VSNYIPVIGLEIHAELTTNSKLFCRCPNTSSQLQTPPNTAVCPVCLGLPGALPVLNKKAVESTVVLGRSLGSTIPSVSKWDRKNYFYPDLPKGYQISQYDQPLCQGGELVWYDRQGHEHKVALTRIHLEEDTGKLTHPEGANYSLIDYNRSSIPLLELVTEPVIASAEEAKQFAEEYQHRLRELGVAEASMEKGQMRCEANISVIPKEWSNDPQKRLSGTKVEIKNLNSFRSLERAILFEVERQSRALDSGDSLRQETRGWNEAKGDTYVMRTKETADDYRYFPEPDLGQLDLSWIPQGTAVTSRPEFTQSLLQAGAYSNFIHIVVNDAKRLAFLQKLIESALGESMRPLAVQWVAQEPLILNHIPSEIVSGLTMVAEGQVRPAVFKQAVQNSDSGKLLEAIGQLQADHSALSDISGIVGTVLEKHPEEVAAYKAGKVQLFGFFVGQVRKELAGKGDPVAIAEELKHQLD
jgi:aspartyl-tRNA(Asn)/glutamyl-tRNA(Gln) amidotransferase subunit B